MIEYLTTSHRSLNILLQAVSADLQVPQYIAGCRALSIIDKLITGPLWRHLQLSTTSVLSMSNICKQKFEEWGEDAQAVLEGGDRLLRQHEKVDEVYKVLFIVIVRFKSYYSFSLNHLLLQYKDFYLTIYLVDSIVQLQTKSVPTTEVSPDRDFAISDRQCLKSLMLLTLP